MEDNSKKREIAFRETLKRSKRIIAVCGAGLSAASGIPTFRGAGGLWRTFNAMSLATPEAFEADPSLVWQFYHYRREAAFKAQSNPAHHALAWFSIPQNRLSVAPNSDSFDIITQNVDGLSYKAAHVSSDPDAAAKCIIEMHGAIRDTKCTTCGHQETNLFSPICPALAGTETLLKPGENINEEKIPAELLPRCKQPGCGGLLRPAVVWFGEAIDLLDPIEELVQQTDMCLVIGTSSTVYPAAGFADVVHGNGGKVAVFNLDRSEGDENADFLFLGPCEETLPKALGAPAASSQAGP